MSAPAGGGRRLAAQPTAARVPPVDAKKFLGLQPVGGDALHWRLDVRPELTTPGDFLFGGCGLGAALVALETASERPTIWATAQYLSHAKTHSTMELTVTLAVVGGHVTQARAVGEVEGREILTVNAALGSSELDAAGIWVRPPVVPPPEECRPRAIPAMFANTILDSVEVRIADGSTFEDIGVRAGPPDSALWARVPGHLEPSAATLAIFGDYLTGAVSQPLGRRTMGRSLDNTIRVVELQPTDWVLCDMRMHAVMGGYAQGIAFLWSTDGTLLATASQSMAIRLWPADVPIPR